MQARKAVTLKGAPDPDVQDARGRVWRLHLNWRHAWGQQLRRISVHGVNVGKVVLGSVAAVVYRGEVHLAFDNAPHLPIVGMSLPSAFMERIQVDLLFPDDVIAVRAVDLCPDYSLSVRFPPKNPLEVLGALAASLIAAVVARRGIWIDSVGEWGNGV